MWFTFPLPVVKTHHYGDLEPFDNSEILMLLKEALYLMVDWQSASYFNNWQSITALPQLPFVFLSCWMFCQVLTWLWFPITPRSLRQFTYGFLLPHHKEMKNVNAKHCFLTITIAQWGPACCTSWNKSGRVASDWQEASVVGGAEANYEQNVDECWHFRTGGKWHGMCGDGGKAFALQQGLFMKLFQRVRPSVKPFTCVAWFISTSSSWSKLCESLKMMYFVVGVRDWV